MENKRFIARIQIYEDGKNHKRELKEIFKSMGLEKIFLRRKFNCPKVSVSYKNYNEISENFSRMQQFPNTLIRNLDIQPTILLNIYAENVDSAKPLYKKIIEHFKPLTYVTYFPEEL